LIEGVYIDFM